MVDRDPKITDRPEGTGDSSRAELVDRLIEEKSVWAVSSIAYFRNIGTTGFWHRF